jgi:hypothetical protein
MNSLRRDDGKRRMKAGNIKAHRGLEDRMGDGSVQVAAGVHKDYDHSEVTATLGRARYCTRFDYSKILGTSSRVELKKLGHDLKEENPMLAADIFTYTGDEEGIAEMKERLFNSTDTQELSFAFYWAQEHGVLEEYCEALLKGSKGDRERALRVGEWAYEELNRTDPEAAEEFAERLETLKKSPTPSKAVEAISINKGQDPKKN